MKLKDCKVMSDILSLLSMSYKGMEEGLITEILEFHPGTVNRVLREIYEIVRKVFDKWNLFHYSLRVYVINEAAAYKEIINQYKNKIAKFLLYSVINKNKNALFPHVNKQIGRHSIYVYEIKGRKKVNNLTKNIKPKVLGNRECQDFKVL